MGGEVTEDFWDDLEDTLVMGDMGAEVAMSLTTYVSGRRENFYTPDQLRRVCRAPYGIFCCRKRSFTDTPSTVLFVGINGAGKLPPLAKLLVAHTLVASRP